MKEQKNNYKPGIFKKNFIKICRIFGYEIIDQSNFFIPTQGKNLDENLNIQGSKSITLPLGETKISRKVKSLSVIFRSCTNINMLTQNKKRLFEEKKSEYTFRSLNSLISSINHAKLSLPNISFEIILIDHDSKKEDLEKIKKILKKANINNSIISLDLSEFNNLIKKNNEKNEPVTKNQFSNMSNIYKSLMIAKKSCDDLIYFVEDDYLHKKDAMEEMVFSYERISSQMNRELIMCPADYPYLYTKLEPTKIFLGFKKHWRTVDESLCTFLTSKTMLLKYWNKFTSMCEYEHYPFEKPLHDIYKSEYCISPLPSIAMHCTNINSIYGLPPTLDWKKIWEDNENY